MGVNEVKEDRSQEGLQSNIKLPEKDGANQTS